MNVVEHLRHTGQTPFAYKLVLARCVAMIGALIDEMSKLEEDLGTLFQWQREARFIA